jgi:hypothetical protein
MPWAMPSRESIAIAIAISISISIAILGIVGDATHYATNGSSDDDR